MKLLKHYRHSSLFVILLATVVFAASAGGQKEQHQQPQQPKSSTDSGTRIELGNPTGTKTDTGPDETREPEMKSKEDQRSGPRPVWVLIDHPLDNNVVRNISGVIDDGYVPVGMDIGDQGVSILYASSSKIVFDRWTIQEFTDLSKLNTELSAFIVDGWLPMDISRTGGGLSVLLVQGDTMEEVLGWRIHEVSAADPGNILQTLEQYRNKGFLPYGVTIDRADNEFWFLLLQTERPEGTDIRRVAFNGFSNEDIQEGITTDVANNLLPWGLARGNNATFVLYLF